MSKPNVATAPASVPVQTPAPNRASLVAKFAARYSVDQDKMLGALKATAFSQGKGKDEVSNEQMLALLVVADQYQLNPFTKEIYAFPDSNRGGITPIISIDGWIRIINERPELESIEFEYAPDDAEDAWIACTITRRDRSKPVTIREYLRECYRETGPWKSHGRRMLRHKALIQCARIAFGFAGIYDPDEAERIANAMAIDSTASEPRGKPSTVAPKAIAKDAPAYTSVPVADLQAALDKSGFPESELFAHFEIDSLAQLPLNQVAAAFEKIASAHSG